MEFVYGDFVAVADRIPAADLVTLDRVICCYDDMERLVGRSAAKATRLYGAVFPRKRGWMRLAIATINLVQRLKRSTFRVFLHDPAAIDAVLHASASNKGACSARSAGRSPCTSVRPARAGCLPVTVQREVATEARCRITVTTRPGCE